jgi:hypothetical protein
MGLHIDAHTETRKIEEQRGKKERSKIQGTFEVGFGSHSSTLGKREEDGEAANPRQQRCPRVDRRAARHKENHHTGIPPLDGVELQTWTTMVEREKNVT